MRSPPSSLNQLGPVTHHERVLERWNFEDWVSMDTEAFVHWYVLGCTSPITYVK